MAREPLRVVLVGCGAIGDLVARHVYGALSECRVVAVADRVAARAGAVGELLGVPGFASLDDALAAVPADAADLRLPHDRHASALIEALDRDLHVVVEKPLATTAQDGRAMLDAVERSGRTVAVAENYPHLRAVRAAAEAIAAGRIGDLVALRSTRAYQLGGVWVRDGWRTGDGPAAGILLDQGTHHTSLLPCLGGDVMAVSATAGRSADTVLVTLRFATGVPAHSLYTWDTPPVAAEAEATAFGTGGRIDVRVDYDGSAGDATLGTGESLAEGENYYDSHRSIVADFVAAIRDERPPVVGVDDALADLEVVLAAGESLRSGGREIAVGR
jgi:UDP-N-acetyl-2-amino-2-deoxyglucuronate dehydrogenase